MTKEVNTKDDTIVYELGYLILPSIPEDKVSQVVSSIKDAISEGGGKELDSEAPISQPLAYEISKTIGASKYVVSDAYLGWVKFETIPENIVTIKKAVEKIEEVVRFLLIKAPRETTFTFAKARAKAKALEVGEKEREPEEVPAVVEEAVVE